MYNFSIQTNTFPDDWKKALVIPIPKTGNLTDVQNYRPISLLPLPGKILEKLIHKQISDHLNDSLLLSDKQRGFRKSHSTLHAAAQLVDYVNNNLDKGRPTLVTYIDFRKAFDCVKHDCVKHDNKLSQLNLDECVVNWTQSYLSDREQRVFANNVYSAPKRVLQGVPQGSVLGPLFYIIYANYLSNLFKHCHCTVHRKQSFWCFCL